MKKKRSILQTMLSPVASAINGFLGYNATDPRRKLIDRNILFNNKSSANTLLSGGLSQLRAYCRHLERNNPTARAGVEALVGLVVGSGIALEPDTGDDKKNQKIREVFGNWTRSIGVNGCDIFHLQQLAMREIPTAGEAIWRVVPGSGPIPLRILPLEGEWLSDVEAQAPSNGCTIVSGLELDRYGQPVSYFLTPPDIGSPERVGKSSIIHIFERRRPLQARGEPWFAPIIETLMNERDLVDAELKASVNSAGIGIVVTSESHPSVDTTDYGTTDDPVQSVGLGSVVRLYPGEDIKSFSHNRPAQQIGIFRQMLRGDIAAALRIPQRYLDRDVSRANYSSMRADMLDTDRLLAPVREWVGHQTIGRVYEIAAPIMSAMVGFAIDPKAYRLLPDAQPYVDPEKDIAGAVAAISSGLSTHEAEISRRGGDIRQVWQQLAAEKKLAESLGLELGDGGESTVGSAASTDAIGKEGASASGEGGEEDDMKRTEFLEALRAMSNASAARHQAPSAAVTLVNETRMDPKTAELMGREIAKNMPSTVVNVPQQAPPQITVQAGEVRMEQAPAPNVIINVPTQAAPVVNVDVSPTPVTIENDVIIPQRKIIAKPGPNGTVEMTPEAES